jgi:hypothetical protein
MTGLKVLGWGPGGRTFALRTRYGWDMGQLASSNLLELIEVHDSLTGKLVASFRVKRIDDMREAGHLYSKAWAEAQPRDRWRAYRGAHPLSGRRGVTRTDGWTLAVEVEHPPRHGQLSVQQGVNVLATVWNGFDPALPQPGGGRGEPGPGARITATRLGQRLTLLSYRLPYDLADITGCNDYTGRPGEAEGRVQAHFAPGDATMGRRVLLALYDRLKGWTDEDPRDLARYYVRTLGPQIKLVAPSEREGEARALCKKLAAARLPVTLLSLDGEPRERTLIHHRGANGPALARRLRKIVGGKVEVKNLARPGWLQLVVLLGER